MNPSVLIVEDDKNTRQGLRQALSRPGWKIFTAADGYRAEDILKSEAVDLILADLRMPGMSGLELLKKCRRLTPSPLFIVMTAYGTVETAVKAMKEGAYDYLTKPVNLDQLEILISRALKGKSLEAENIYLREQLEKKFGFENITGQSAKMEEIFELIRQIRNSRSTVLISGESGTGKELVARAIHQQSDRKNEPFVPIHCASLAPTLLESELFGHEKGAFTGAVTSKKGRLEIAAGGTVFLDEISEIPAEVQVKLLRFLETHEFERVGGTKPIPVDIRLLAATNADLEELMKRGEFREDLYYRLNVIRIHLPPLRERREDIPLLVRRFLAEFSRQNKKKSASITPRAMYLLQSYDWPGNVRELKNCLESMVVLAKKSVLDADDLPPQIRGSEIALSPDPVSLNLKTAGKELIQRALSLTGNNKTRAARLLGISRRTLYRKLDSYGLKNAENA